MKLHLLLQNHSLCGSNDFGIARLPHYVILNCPAIKFFSQKIKECSQRTKDDFVVFASSSFLLLPSSSSVFSSSSSLTLSIINYIVQIFGSGQDFLHCVYLKETVFPAFLPS